MDRAKLYAHLRSAQSAAFGKSLSKGQVDGIERILDEAQKRGVPLMQLAYILATVYHETAHTMQPIRERGGEKYLRSKKYYPWVGEGLVQVTWEVNHRKFGATKPGQLMTWPIALKALFDGMLKGMFTGKSLGQYVGGELRDYVGARRVVNGTDKDNLIASYAMSFESGLRKAGYIGQAPKPKPVAPVSKETLEPEKPAPQAGAPIPRPEPEKRGSLLDLFMVLFRWWK